MENAEFLIKGLVIGLAIAAPVGPIGVLWPMGVYGASALAALGLADT